MPKDKKEHSAWWAVLDATGTGQPGYPLIEICSDRRVLIENHRGLRAYDTEKVVVSSKIGCICVEGRSLCVASMTGHQLVICGKILAVRLEGGQ